MQAGRIITFFLIMLTACRQDSKEKYVINPKARLLNDSAMVTIRSSKNADYQAAIALLEKAIIIDSSYVRAYQNRLSFESELKQYDKALATSKELNKLRPENPDFLIMTGVLYEKTGDTVSSVQYFQKSLTKYNKILDTLDSGTPNYFVAKMYKGINLILLNQQDNGLKILKSLYDHQANDMYKEALTPFINSSKQSIIDNMFNQQKVTVSTEAKQN